MKQRLAHFFHFRLLSRLVRCWPRPIWRLPAALMAIGRVFLDIKTRHLAGNVLVALGQRNTLLARWRFSWQVAYHVETNLLLGLQADRLDLPWAKGHVAYDVVPPAGGAILVSLHHANSRVGFLRLSETISPFGVIVAGILAENATGDEGPREFANVMDPYSRRSRNLRMRVFGGNIFSAQHDIRRALRFLQQDGYLVIQPDARFVGEKRWPILGKAFPFAEGAVWFSRHSGKPLIPYVVVPARQGWRVVLDTPLEPTMDALAAGLERCLRAAPTCWHPDYWQAWDSMPTWAEYQARLGATNHPADGDATNANP